MTAALATTAFATFPGINIAVATLINPVRVLRAQQRLNEFRTLEDAALVDMGLSRADVASASLVDFLRAPHP